MVDQVICEMDYGSGFQQKPLPLNWKGLSVHLGFANNTINASLTGTDFEWVEQNAKELYTYYQQGITGGNGIYCSVGLRFYTCGTTSFLLFDGYINLIDPSAEIQCDKVKAPCVDTRQTDWIQDLFGEIDFSFLAQLNPSDAGAIVPQLDYKLTPYFIHKERDYAALATLALSDFEIFIELKHSIYKIAEYGGDILGHTQESTQEIPAGSPSVWTLLSKIAGLILYTIYLGFLIIAMLSLLQLLISSFVQRKKYKLCMRERDCWQHIADKFGMQFSSTIYDSSLSAYQNATYMPEKNTIPDLSNPLNVFHRHYDESVGFPNNTKNYGYPNLNCAEFVTQMLKKYNGTLSIITATNGQKFLEFEEKHFWNNAAVYTIPNTDKPGNTFNLPDPHSTNASELPSTLEVIFMTDESDKNTLQRYTGTSCSVTVSPINTYNKFWVVNGDAKKVDIETALAKRKDYLTEVENYISTIENDIANFFNAIISGINSITGFVNAAISSFGGNPAAIPNIPLLPTNIFNGRIGAMCLSDDEFKVAKTFIGIQSGGDWLIAPNSEADMSGVGLMNTFHGKELATRGNQQLIYKNKTFPFCCKDFIALINKNVITTPDGYFGKIQDMEWNPYTERAQNTTYRIFRNFTTNIKETVVIDGSQP